MTFNAFLIISVHKILNFGHFLQKRDRQGDGPIDGRTETPAYIEMRGRIYKAVFLEMRYISNLRSADA